MKNNIISSYILSPTCPVIRSSGFVIVLQKIVFVDNNTVQLRFFLLSFTFFFLCRSTDGNKMTLCRRRI